MLTFLIRQALFMILCCFMTTTKRYSCCQFVCKALKVHYCKDCFTAGPQKALKRGEVKCRINVIESKLSDYAACIQRFNAPKRLLNARISFWIGFHLHGGHQRERFHDNPSRLTLMWRERQAQQREIAFFNQPWPCVCAYEIILLIHAKSQISDGFFFVLMITFREVNFRKLSLAWNSKLVFKSLNSDAIKRKRKQQKTFFFFFQQKPSRQITFAKFWRFFSHLSRYFLEVINRIFNRLFTHAKFLRFSTWHIQWLFYCCLIDWNWKVLRRLLVDDAARHAVV